MIRTGTFLRVNFRTWSQKDLTAAQMETPQSLTDIPHEEVHSELHFNPSRHVCVAIDDSEHSGTSLEWAMENILNAEKDQIILLHCRPYSIFPSPPLGLSGGKLIRYMGVECTLADDDHVT